MRELGLDLAAIRPMFVTVQEIPYALFEVPAGRAEQIANELAVPVRRYYVSDAVLETRHAKTAIPKRRLVQAKLPDRGPVMSGDFGELLAAIFQAAQEYPTEVVDPKKLRLKQDRRHPAPYSDVVQFILPHWPSSSAEDRLLCAEVKTKATNGQSTPITSAMADSKKDRDGRLVKTLAWLRERAMHEDLGTATIEQIERFIKATDHPPAAREFRAFAVICSSLIEAETAGFAPPPAAECALFVISVPDMKRNYEALYEAVCAKADEMENTG